MLPFLHFTYLKWVMQPAPILKLAVMVKQKFMQQEVKLKKSATTEWKEYVLLDHMKPTAPFYIQVGEGEAVRIDKLQKWRPYTQYTIITKDGDHRTARLKLNAPSIWLDEQIAKGMPANVKMTPYDRNAVQFRWNKLRTNIAMVQEFLENSPEFLGFEGESMEGVKPAFKLFDKANASKEEFKEFTDRLAAANKIKDMSLESAQNSLIRIYGVSYELPQSIEDCKLELASALDISPRAFEIVMSEKMSADEEARLLIGKLLNLGSLSFQAKENQVSITRDGGKTWQAVKELSNEYDEEQRESLFVQFLVSPEGEPLYKDLKGLLPQTAKSDKDKTIKT